MHDMLFDMHAYMQMKLGQRTEHFSRRRTPPLSSRHCTERRAQLCRQRYDRTHATERVNKSASLVRSLPLANADHT